MRRALTPRGRVVRLAAAAERRHYPRSGAFSLRHQLYYEAEWSCALCGRAAPAPARRCRACGQHRRKAHADAAASEADLARQTTAVVRATLPAGACADAFLAEVFDLRYDAAA
eukprot:gene16709-9980_t